MSQLQEMSKISWKPDLLFVSQNKTLILCALKSKGNGHVVIQSKAIKVTWESAS